MEENADVLQTNVDQGARTSLAHCFTRRIDNRGNRDAACSDPLCGVDKSAGESFFTCAVRKQQSVKLSGRKKMRLLLAVDTIKTLDIVIKFIEARSWPQGTEAAVLSVVEDETVPIETWRAEGYGVAAVRREMRRRGEQISALVIDRLRAIGIPAQVTVMRGDPAFLIPFAARKWSSDLILIRANNRMNFRNWLLGSVAKSVVEYAPCSVEVVRPPAATASRAPRSNMRILLATDGSDASLAASQSLAEIELPKDAEVKVVSVINPIRYSLEEIGISGGKASERAHQAIARTVNMLKSGPSKIKAEVIAGRRVPQIVARARDWDADLIVVGTEERTGMRRLLSRGTAVAVANRAHCSVRVVRGGSVAHNEQITEQNHGVLAWRNDLKRQQAFT
jgi:nucleotide-binding universal stress UspA family protein